MWAGQDDTQKFKTRVLKPPGGDSSDIFGTAPEETSPRRTKQRNQSQLGWALFGDDCNNTGGNGNNSGAKTPRGNNKPGNDTHNRLFGPPDALPTTPKSTNHMRSSIAIGVPPSSFRGAETSPAKSTGNTNSASAVSGGVNGFAGSNANGVTGGSSCITRNPVTGVGVAVTAVRRITRKCTDGNPVTGADHTNEPQNNGLAVHNGTSSSNSSVGDKSNDSSPAAKGPARTRVPPGGYSSKLW